MARSSLPSFYGIGTLGKAAYDFADFLHDAQGYWQMLPLGPTSYGDSPYQVFRLRGQSLLHRPGAAGGRRAADEEGMQVLRLGR